MPSSGVVRLHVHKKLAFDTERPTPQREIYLLVMELHSFHTPWTEGEDSTLLGEDFERANWVRSRQVNLPWENSSERQDQDLEFIGARDAALGGLILSLLVATILG